MAWRRRLAGIYRYAHKVGWSVIAIEASDIRKMLRSTRNLWNADGFIVEDGVFYAYGTPWSGKDGININRKVPLAGICFLKQGSENRIRRLSVTEAFAMCMAQTQRFYKTENAEKHMLLMQQLVCTVPVWELTNYPGAEAAQLAHDTMTR